MVQDSFIRRDRSAIAAWLVISALLVVCMVFVGGYTRLSGSGLSITQWKLLHGTIPPINEVQWQEEFEAYRQSPQYEKINRGMTLEAFKAIYWPEYFHRLLGRLVGAVFFIPWAIFLLRRSFTKPFALRLFGIFLLGGLQGLIGWLMVKSGLVNDPHVSHFRLALHLSVALLIFALLLWSTLDITRKPQPMAQGSARKWYGLWFALLCVQIVFGALTAGLHAGLVYNTWPDMNGYFIPPEVFALQNASENPVLMQFIHRTLAVFMAFSYGLWWYFQRHYVTKNQLGRECAWVAAVLAIQFILGVLTLLHEVPLPLALMHQMGALALLAVAVVLLHRLYVKEKT